MPGDQTPPSKRRDELLEAAYRYVLEHGLADLSLRPLATAIGSSPRVLLYLFDSKEGLVQALLARARIEELDLLQRLRAEPRSAGTGLAETAQAAGQRDTPAGIAERTLVLAVLRGAMLDLLATGDVERITAAVHSLPAAEPSPRAVRSTTHGAFQPKTSGA